MAQPKEVRSLAEESGGTLIALDLEEVAHLAELSGQGQYRYAVGSAWIGGESEEDPKAKYRQLVERLSLKLSDGGRLHA